MSDAIKGTANEEIEKVAEATHFEALYFAWLHSLYYMPIADGQDDPGGLVDRRCDEADEAARQLLVRPATSEHHIWWKWEALKSMLDADSRDGQAGDRRTIVALACIEADLMRFGFGNPTE
jgi:hypothetical protein